MYSLIEAAPLKRLFKKKDKLLNAQRGMGQTFMSPMKSVYTFNAFSFPRERRVEPLLHLMSTQLSPELVNNHIKHFPCLTKNPVLIKNHTNTKRGFLSPISKSLIVRRIWDKLYEVVSTYLQSLCRATCLLFIKGCLCA